MINNLIICLHPYNISTKNVKFYLKNVQKKIKEKLENKNIKWLFPKANNLHTKSWFNYIKEYDGLKEDIIDIQSLIKSRIRLIYYIKKMIKKYNVNKSNIIIYGISQGGCMALDLCNYLKFKKVITVVSYRMTISCKKKILCKWIAINAKYDDIYNYNWCKDSYKQAEKIINIHDDHYLFKKKINNILYNTFINSIN